MIRKFARLAVAALLPFAAYAQEYPTKPVRLIVPFAPGGVMDLTARSIASPLGEALGQAVVVENRPGGGGNIGTDVVAQAAPDGYTLLMAGDNNSIAPALYAKLNHDVMRDFAPISNLVTGAHIFVAPLSLPANSIRELVALAKARPGALSYASPGNGTAQHLGGEMFKLMAGGLQITHIPYKGGGQAIGDVVGGQVSFGVLGLAPVIPHLKGGKLKALGVTGKRRVAILPDVPTLAESGVPNFETLQWYGVVAPAATPAPIIARLHAELLKAARTQAFVDRLTAAGMDVVTSPQPEDYQRFIRDDMAKWPAVVKAAGARVD
ncbi:MAG: tripartite tricarboxylate transporter substrate binding protein [Proteobacteria bacterium]|nr:tripartite tricarboxylate transporter substrate binding protein [Pseudomonadota bacterium]